MGRGQDWKEPLNPLSQAVTHAASRTRDRLVSILAAESLDLAPAEDEEQGSPIVLPLHASTSSGGGPCGGPGPGSAKAIGKAPNSKKATATTRRRVEYFSRVLAETVRIAITPRFHFERRPDQTIIA
jgi:hypothetical protein